MRKGFWKELDEWLFEWHVRVCQIAEPKYHKMCDASKKQFKKWLRKELKEGLL